MGYLCADFSLPRPLCSRVRSDVRERQTDVRQKQAGHNYLWTAGRTSLTTLADSHSFVGGQTKQTVYSQLCILRHRFVYFLGDMSGRVTTSRQTHERYRWSCYCLCAAVPRVPYNTPHRAHSDHVALREPESMNGSVLLFYRTQGL